MIMPCTVFIFIVLLQNPSWGQNGVFNFIGRELSMYIYYWHGLIGGLLASLLNKVNISDKLHANVILVFVSSIICGYVIYSIKKLVYKRRNIRA